MYKNIFIVLLCVMMLSACSKSGSESFNYSNAERELILNQLTEKQMRIDHSKSSNQSNILQSVSVSGVQSNSENYSLSLFSKIIGEEEEFDCNYWGDKYENIRLDNLNQINKDLEDDEAFAYCERPNPNDGNEFEVYQRLYTGDFITDLYGLESYSDSKFSVSSFEGTVTYPAENPNDIIVLTFSPKSSIQFDRDSDESSLYYVGKIDMDIFTIDESTSDVTLGSDSIKETYDFSLEYEGAASKFDNLDSIPIVVRDEYGSCVGSIDLFLEDGTFGDIRLSCK